MTALCKQRNGESYKREWKLKRRMPTVRKDKNVALKMETVSSSEMLVKTLQDYTTSQPSRQSLHEQELAVRLVISMTTLRFTSTA